MTRRAADPRMSLSIDPGTGFIGKVPGFNNIKNTHKQSVRPFLTSVNSPSQLSYQEKDVSSPPQRVGIDWTKITDPRQSIRIADSIDP